MHRNFKKYARRYPRFRHLLIETNQAVREGILAMTVRQWLELSPAKGGFDVLLFSRMTGEMIADQLVSHHIEIRDLVTDELVAIVSSFDDIATVYDGKTLLTRKDVDYSELDSDPSHFVYMEGIYTFADLYGTLPSNTA